MMTLSKLRFFLKIVGGLIENVFQVSSFKMMCDVFAL